MTKRLRLSQLAVMGSLAPNHRGEIVILSDVYEFVIDKRGAENARLLCAQLLGAAECLDPRGYRLELPLSDTDLAAPVEMEREAEEMENKRRPTRA